MNRRTFLQSLAAAFVSAPFLSSANEYDDLVHILVNHQPKTDLYINGIHQTELSDVEYFSCHSGDIANWGEPDGILTMGGTDITYESH